MQDAARTDYVKSMHEYLGAVSDLVDPYAKQRSGKSHAALTKRQATDEDRTQYLGLMAAGLRNANKQGFASLKELRQAMDALKETLTDINGATGNW